MRSGSLSDGTLSTPYQGDLFRCSQQGAQASLPKAGSQAWTIFFELQRSAATYHELVERTGLPLATMCARVNWLKAKGLVQASGMKVGKYGVNNTVWAVR